MTPYQHLKSLPVLPKPHGSSPIYSEQLIGRSLTLQEVFRVCGSVPVSPANTDAAIVAAGKTARRLGCKVCLSFSPVAGKDNVVYLRGRMPVLTDAIGDAVTLVQIDDERAKSDAIVAERQALYGMLKTAWPEACVHYYGFACQTPAASTTGWSDSSPWFAGTENSDAANTPLYHAYEWESTKQQLARTATLSDLLIIPNLALGSGYLWGPRNTFHRWEWQIPGNTSVSYKLGQCVNIPWCSEPVRRERYGPWHRVPAVIFYPSCKISGPLEAQQSQWLPHFLAYCDGAAMRD